jgi:hypothetical protein
MKNILKIILLSLFFINCKAQTVVDISTYNDGDNSNKYFKDINNNYVNFTGTWENTTGNITFRVNLWKDTKVDFTSMDSNCYKDMIRGSYQIIQNAGSASEIILYNSVKSTPNGVWESIMFLSTGNNIYLGGAIDDNCAKYPTGENAVLSGHLLMQITNPGNVPATAHWTVTRKGGAFGYNISS